MLLLFLISCLVTGFMPSLASFASAAVGLFTGRELSGKNGV